MHIDMRRMALALLVMTAGAAEACMTFVVGRKASPTGYVIVGHNEDDPPPIGCYHGMLPAKDWPAGSVLPATVGCNAHVPQAAHTYRCYWSEVKFDCGDGNADAFFNENGVFVCSNSGGYSTERMDDPTLLTEGGVKFNLRRTVGERATSARDGVRILGEMVEKYGYAPSARIYTIADRNEAWLAFVVHGKHFIAVRVPDDQIAIMPNLYTIYELEDWAKEDLVLSRGLLENAKEKGFWDGRSKFNFAKAYQGSYKYGKKRAFEHPNNTARFHQAIRLITGEEWTEGRPFPFSVKPKKLPFSAEDLRKLLIAHNWKNPDGSHDRYSWSICAEGTVESTICQFAAERKDDVLSVAPGHGCDTPWYTWKPFSEPMPKELDQTATAEQRLATHVNRVAPAKATSGSDLTVVENGVPGAAIVLGEKPVKAARLAAAELQHVLKLVTGAELPIVAARPAEGTAFYVGSAAGGDAAVRGDPFTKEEYLVAFRGRDVYLCGHDAADFSKFDYADEKTFPDIIYSFRSTTYAVYDFLEKYVGVRFYGFGDQGIAFEPRSTLSIAPGADLRRAPAMDAYRRPYFGSRVRKQLPEVTAREEKLLNFRWRVNCMFGEVNHSVMGAWLHHYKPSKTPARAKLFRDPRPDWFAQGYKGRNAPHSLKRWDYPDDPDLPPQLCTSSEGPIGYFADEAVRMHAGERIEGSYANRPVMEGEPFYYPVQEDDCCWWCQCDRCLNNPALKDYRFRHFDWVNRIARAVKAKDPAVGIATLAYSDTLRYPKGLVLDDSVLVQMCLAPQSWFHPGVYEYQHGAYRDWVKNEGPRRPLTLWLYFLCPWSEATIVHKYGKFFPIHFPRHTGRFFKEFAADGIRGFFAEITPRYYLLEAYLAARLSDDPSLDPEAMLEEYYRLYYGAAGAAMKRFAETFEAESYDIANYSPHARALTFTTSYIYRLHSERDNWFLGSAERVKRLDAMMDEVKAAAKTPLERARVEDFCTRIWNTAVEGRREYEERERVRAIPIPYMAAGAVENCAGDVSKVDFAKARRSAALRTMDNGEAKSAAAFRLANDSTHLYFEFREKGGGAAAHPELDGWENGVEVFLATKREADYFQLCVGTDGKIMAHRQVIVAGVTRTEPVQLGKAVSTCTPEGWTVRFAVPFAEIPHGAKAGEELFGNFFRSRRWKDGESTVWSPIFCEAYLAGLHRFGTIYTTGEVPRGEVMVEPEKWNLQDKKGGLKPGESFSFKDGVLSLAGGEAKKPFYVYQYSPFYPVRTGTKVVFEFDAKGSGELVVCLPELVGRAYFAGMPEKRLRLASGLSHHRVELEVAELRKDNPPTTARLGFGVLGGGTAEVTNLHVSFE